MNKGDILIYIGKDTPEFKKGDRVIFWLYYLNPEKWPQINRDLHNQPEDRDNMLIIIKTSTNINGIVEARVKSSKDFIDIKTLRDNKIDNILNL